MFEQSKLRDLRWACANSKLDCDAVFPCFDAAGDVKLLLVVTEQWGWLAAAPGKLTRDGRDVRFAGPLEELFKLSAQAADRLAGLYHFDPNWLARGADLDAKSRDAVLRTNLAGACFGKLPISEVAYDDPLAHVQRMEAGAALWRRQLALPAVKQFLQSSPAIATDGLSGAGGGGVSELRRADRDALYQPTGGPLKLIASARRVGGGRSTIGTAAPPAGKAPLGSPLGRPARPAAAVSQPVVQPHRPVPPPESHQPAVTADQRPISSPSGSGLIVPPAGGSHQSSPGATTPHFSSGSGELAGAQPAIRLDPELHERTIEPTLPPAARKAYAVAPDDADLGVVSGRRLPVAPPVARPPVARPAVIHPPTVHPPTVQPPTVHPPTGYAPPGPPPVRRAASPFGQGTAAGQGHAGNQGGAAGPTTPPAPPRQASSDPVQQAIENIRRRLGR